MAAEGPARPLSADDDDDEGVVGPYPGGDEDVVGYPEVEENEDVVGPYPGAEEEDDAVGPYPGGDDDDNVVGPYPGGDYEGAVVGPYPGGDDDDDVVGPYPGGDDEEYPDTDAQYESTSVAQSVPPAVAAPPPPAAPAAPPPPPPAPPPESRKWRPPDWSKPPVMHNPRLEAWENGRMARSMSLKGARYFIVGRNGEVADVIVPDSSVSRGHAAIINSSTATFVHDLDSAHGTYYDVGGRTMHVPKLGVRLAPSDEPTKLVEGASLRFGTVASTVFRVVGLEAATVKRWHPPPWASRPEGRPRCLEVRSNHVANPYLDHLAGGDVDETITLTGACTTFGRTASLVDIVVADASISRQHAAIIHSSDTPSQSFLVDLGSASGSYVDGERCPPGERPVRLVDGAVISLGVCPATYTFRAAKPAEAAASGGPKRKR